MTRRGFLARTALGALGASRTLEAFQRKQTHTAAGVYAAVGSELTRYDLDVARAALTRRSQVVLPENVQEAWRHPSRPLLYVGWSNGASGAGASHCGVSVLNLDSGPGAIDLAAPPTSLAWRPIHLTIDRDGRYLLAAYNMPSGVTVHRISADGAVGPPVSQPAAIDAGIYAHQVRVAPSNRLVILMTRGNEPAASRPEDPGALKVFGFANGVLTPRASIALDGGHAFRSRHLDFHPSGRWAYLTLESQNRLITFGLGEDGLSERPLFNTTTLSTPTPVRQQAASTIHVHPDGRFVYVGNRAAGVSTINGVAVSAGGENTIAVFAIHQRTGEPTLVHSVDTRGFQPRTFALDPTGRILVVGNQSELSRLESGRVSVVRAGLSLFRVGADGQLTFVQKYDVDTTSEKTLFWTGVA